MGLVGRRTIDEVLADAQARLRRLTPKAAHAAMADGWILLIVDELGFAPLDAVGSQLLFRVVAAAYERRSLAVASHWPFEEWGRFLPETVTATSLLDRLLHHATVVVTSGESFRMREARSRVAPRAKAAEGASGSRPARTTR